MNFTQEELLNKWIKLGADKPFLRPNFARGEKITSSDYDTLYLDTKICNMTFQYHLIPKKHRQVYVKIEYLTSDLSYEFVELINQTRQYLENNNWF